MTSDATEQPNATHAEHLPLAAVHTWTPTGDPRVDAAVDLVGQLQELPVSEHLAVFDDVHRRLQDTLADAAGQ